jgi:hypothetical protein
MNITQKHIASTSSIPKQGGLNFINRAVGAIKKKHEEMSTIYKVMPEVRKLGEETKGISVKF